METIFTLDLTVTCEEVFTVLAKAWDTPNHTADAT
jgi:hypothetical protein